jgi:hypothetical protein
MLTTAWNGWLVIAVGALVASECSRPEHRLVRKQITVIDKITAAFEKVTEKKVWKEIEPELQAHFVKMSALEKDLVALGPERRKAAMTAHQAQYDRAIERLKTAKEQAVKFR